MKFQVREENMERLNKKLASLKKKCEKAHCEFKYEEVGSEYKTFTADNGEEVTVKYIEVDVEGEAKYNGWKFVAVIDHHKEGNVIRAYDEELEIPEKYLTCGPTCEHCNKIRSRKDTYLIRNEETNEFKQVGKSCLQEFTNGLSAENVAFFCSMYEEVENSYGYSGSSFNRYISVERILKYAFECYRHFGYQKSASSFEDEIPVGYRSTMSRVVDYYYINRATGKVAQQLKEEMEEVGFNADSEYAVNTTEEALNWIRNETNLDNQYIRNLHIICSDEYTDYRSLGILVSLTVAYARHLDQVAAYEKKQKKIEEEKNSSEYVGEVGKRIEVEAFNFACVYSSENMYGMSYLYKWNDAEGNIFTWFSSNAIDQPETVVSVKGTVKEHSEYRGVKQTVMTRCKVTCKTADKEEPEEGSSDISDAIDTFLEYVNS